MKTLFTILITLALANTAYSRIITLDNNYPSAGMFTNIQDAHDAANPGDTIYVYPSYDYYNCSVNIDRKVHLYGSGYCYGIGSHQTNLPNATYSSNGKMQTATLVGNIVFNPGSEGSSIQGFGKSEYGEFDIEIKADNIRICRNRLSYINILGKKGIIVFNNALIRSPKWYVYRTLMNINDYSQVFILNNIIVNYNAGDCRHCIIANNSDLTIKYNIIYSFVLVDNIYQCDFCECFYITGKTAQIEKNIISSKLGSFNYGGYINNFHNYEPDKLFINPISMNPTDFETYYNFDFHFRADAPAEALDKGIYNGELPFVDCGIPDIPSIYELNSPDVGYKDSGLKIKIKARANR